MSQSFDKRIVIVSMLIAAIFSADDLTTTLSPVCNKDLSFSIAIVMLLFLGLNPKSGSNQNVNPVKNIAVLWSLGILFGIAGSTRLPDSWLYTQNSLSDLYPVIELSWALILIPVFGFLFMTAKHHAKTLMVLLAVLLMSGASARIMDAGNIGNGAIVLNETETIKVSELDRRIVNIGWISRNINYQLLEEKIAGDDFEPFWFAFSQNGEAKQMSLRKLEDGYYLSVFEKGEPNHLIMVLGQLFIFMAMSFVTYLTFTRRFI